MKSEFSRRDFAKLSVAAFGGVIAGSALTGCQTGGDGAQGPAGEKHACKGLNACKGQGAGGDNACAGQGKCATGKHHACAGHNECKGQGGCGENPGANACKGKGGCAVPMKGEMWKKARASFEAKMKADGKAFGSAPK